MATPALRPVADGDLPAIHALIRSWEGHWYGAPEQSPDEVADTLELIEHGTVLPDPGLGLAGFAGYWRNGSTLTVRPGSGARDAARTLVRWLTERGAPELDALAQDAELLAVAGELGWTYSHSAYDLTRAVVPGEPLAAPHWPAGIELRPFRTDDATALHRLIYVDAEWAAVRGHHERGLDEWRQIFLKGRTGAELPVLAWSGDELAAAAVLRHWDDGSGYLAQLAVGRAYRRRGLARCLLLESFGRLVADGATRLDLAVAAENRGALDLYLSVGLEVTREWQTFVPAG